MLRSRVPAIRIAVSDCVSQWGVLSYGLAAQSTDIRS